MLLALSAAAVALVAVLAELVSPRLRRRRAARKAVGGRPEQVRHDPGRELRAEQRARDLLRSCVNQEEWEMYRELGFLRVSGAPRSNGAGPQEACAYLLYPHQPIVAYVPETRRLVGEYCVTFEDRDEPYGGGRLPNSDDVLAKWMALTADEPRLISMANMHLPGRQVDIQQVERDLQRLAQWEQARARRLAAAIAPPNPHATAPPDLHPTSAS
ncbi:MAG: hypothetical protein ACJ764_10650 [Solirubrobacteraceae bacterium]